MGSKVAGGGALECFWSDLDKHPTCPHGIITRYITYNMFRIVHSVIIKYIYYRTYATFRKIHSRRTD